MSLEELTAGTGMRTALGAVVIGLALCGWTTVRAVKLEPVPTAPATVDVVPGALTVPVAGIPVNVRAAVDADLFSVDRSAPSQRYRMPGEGTADSTAAPAVPVVLGTAIAADGQSFATCQLESSRLVMVRVGDRLGNYLVKSIARGRVVFQTPAGTSLEILAPTQGS